MYLVRYVIMYLLCLYCSLSLVESHFADNAPLDTDIFRMQHHTVETNQESAAAEDIPKARSRRDLGARDETCQSQEQRFLDELKTVKDEFSHVVCNQHYKLYLVYLLR